MVVFFVEAGTEFSEILVPRVFVERKFQKINEFKKFINSFQPLSLDTFSLYTLI